MEVKERLVELFGNEAVEKKLQDIEGLILAQPGSLAIATDAELRSTFNPILYPVEENNLFTSFVMPPFSTLDTRGGKWQSRKQEWITLLGNVGETKSNLIGDDLMAKINDGTSYFDPVLAELIITWFSNPEWRVLNPFCGEATVAALASFLNRKFVGIDIRQEQVDKNTKLLTENGYKTSKFVCGDSVRCVELMKENNILPEFDLIFSSPPYYDLEVYSEDGGDVSQMGTYKEFIEMYKTIFERAVSMLRRNRFCVVKVSEVRNKGTGEYYNFVGDNVRIFKELGLHYYNELILVNSVGTAPMRASNTFRTRKMVRLHQNILVFYKGDMEQINEIFDSKPPVYVMPRAKTASLFEL